MGPFFLVLVMLDAHTGDPVSSSVIGDPYHSIEECANAAVQQGVRRSEDGKASLFFCQEAGDRYSWMMVPPRRSADAV